MNRALLLITAPAAAAIALWGGAVLGYKVGITLAVVLVVAATLTFLIYRPPSTAAQGGPSTHAQDGERKPNRERESNRKAAAAGKGRAAGGWTRADPDHGSGRPDEGDRGG